MSVAFSDRVRQQLRDELLDAASAAVLAGGWKALRMQSVADAVGVSRQTVYNEFDSKAGLAAALVSRLTSRFLDSVEAALLAAPTMRDGWADGVRTALQSATEEPLLITVLNAPTADEFLPLLTSQSAPLVRTAVERLAPVAIRRWPSTPAEAITVATETAIRLTLSHIVQPTQPPEQVAEQVAELLTAYLMSSTERAGS